ncbi:MAG: hypothetical protein M3R70_08525 [Actinomycetota bacterium]|nr:hypothetical protein [Actinomycetota bacterium]
MLKNKRFLLTAVAFLTLNATLWLATIGFAMPRPLINYFLGTKMIRAEILVREGQVSHDFRLDQGRVRSLDRSNMMITLKERDGAVVTIPVAADTLVKVNGKTATFQRLRAGWQALVIRDGEKTTQIHATKPASKK